MREEEKLARDVYRTL
ncbi:MAG: hypothetical protein IPF70_12910 [Saprospiraceae bacterium]|nr:hypothetical protein [Saprospiraceae bacterium]